MDTQEKNLVFFTCRHGGKGETVLIGGNRTVQGAPWFMVYIRTLVHRLKECPSADAVLDQQLCAETVLEGIRYCHQCKSRHRNPYLSVGSKQLQEEAERALTVSAAVMIQCHACTLESLTTLPSE